MKLTVSEWTRVQGKLPRSVDGVRLDDRIEERTFGKQWSQAVAISLKGDDLKMVEAARAAIAAELDIDGDHTQAGP